MSIDEHESQLDQLEMQNVRETLKSDQYYSPSSGSYCAPPSSSSSPSSSASISAAMTVVNVRDLNHNGGNVGRGPVSAFDRGENSDEEIHDIPLDFDRHAIERSKKTEVERFYTSVNRCLRIDIALLWCALALGTSCLFALGALTTDSEVFYYYKKLTGDGDPGGFMEAGLSKMTVYTAVNGRPPVRRPIHTVNSHPFDILLPLLSLHFSLRDYILHLYFFSFFFLSLSLSLPHSFVFFRVCHNVCHSMYLRSVL